MFEIQWSAVRRHVTFAQDQHLGSDKSFLRLTQHRDQLSALVSVVQDIERAIISQSDPQDAYVALIWRKTRRLKKSISHLSVGTSIWLRVCVCVVTALIVAWTLWLAARLDERAQFVRSVGTHSRTAQLSFAVARFRYGDLRIAARFLEDRVLPPLPPLFLYSITGLVPKARHLHGNFFYTVGVAISSLLWLLGLSFRSERQLLYRFIEKRIFKSRRPYLWISTDQLQNLCQRLDKEIEPLVKNFDEADISDLLGQSFCFIKEDGQDLLNHLQEPLPQSHRTQTANAPRKWKVLIFVFGVGIVALLLASYYRYPWLMSDSISWGTWVLARIGRTVFGAKVTTRDTLRLFSNTVAGTFIATLVLNIPILVTNGAVLQSLRNCILLACSLVVAINVWSNQVAQFPLWLAKTLEARWSRGCLHFSLVLRLQSLAGKSHEGSEGRKEQAHHPAPPMV